LKRAFIIVTMERFWSPPNKGITMLRQSFLLTFALLLLGTDRSAAQDLEFEYGDKIAAKRAGLRKGDIITSVDGKDQPMTESELLADILERKRPGDSMSTTFLRDGTRKTVSYPLP
jgi:PDZ domain-containing secreted protein